jgi:hypothetical protein
MNVNDTHTHVAVCTYRASFLLYKICVFWPGTNVEANDVKHGQIRNWCRFSLLLSSCLPPFGPFGHRLPHPTRMLVVAMNGDHRYHHNATSNAIAGPSKPSPAPSPPPTHPTFDGTANASADLGPSSSPPHHPVPLAPLNLFLPPPGTFRIPLCATGVLPDRRKNAVAWRMSFLYSYACHPRKS